MRGGGDAQQRSMRALSYLARITLQKKRASMAEAHRVVRDRERGLAVHDLDDGDLIRHGERGEVTLHGLVEGDVLAGGVELVVLHRHVAAVEGDADVLGPHGDGRYIHHIPARLFYPENEVEGVVALLQQEVLEVGVTTGDGEVEAARVEVGPVVVGEDGEEALECGKASLLTEVVVEESIALRRRGIVDELIEVDLVEPLQESKEEGARNVLRLNALGYGVLLAGRGPGHVAGLSDLRGFAGRVLGGEVQPVVEAAIAVALGVEVSPAGAAGIPSAEVQVEIVQRQE